MKRYYISVFIIISSFLFSQIQRVEPNNWWVGFKNKDLQILFYGKELANYQIEVDAKAFDFVKLTKPDSKNYLFLDVKIKDNAIAGTYPIWFVENGQKKFKYDYVLKDRTQSSDRNQGVTEKDLVYLIMPDRFANGDYSNDVVKTMREKTINRDSMYYRHGGDLQGIINKLDYIKDLGVTAIWNTPEIENDMKQASYHGYAATDLYKIDPRYGTNDLYKKYVEAAHQKGLKIIKDMVPNHIGSEHWMMADLPFKDWVHQWDKYTNTSYRFEPAQDPYASQFDKKEAFDGWFVPTMPDMNEQNPFVAKYLNQNYIWWVENFGIDGLRVDTFAYNDLPFMSGLYQNLYREFPKLTIFGETLMYQPSNQSFFTKNKLLPSDVTNNQIQGITDSALKEAIYEALNGKFGWYDGVNRLYNLLAQDYLYQDPNKNVIFLDNHDMSRFYSVVGEDMAKFKSGIALLLTMKKIPQLYYGTEIVMKNFSNPDGLVRSDMRGGWKEDKINQFSKEGRTEKENEAFDYIKTLANFRKNSSALSSGRMMQFYPKDGVYIYFRYDAKQTIMIAYNSLDKEKDINWDRLTERTKGFTQAKDVMTGKIYPDFKQIKLAPKTTLVLELIK